MPTSFEKLRKILGVEAHRNYDNAAIIGGLDKMVLFWAPQALKAGMDETTIDEVVAWLNAYPNLSAQEREAAMGAFLERLDTLETQESTAPSAPPGLPEPSPSPPSAPREAEQPPPPPEKAEPEPQKSEPASESASSPPPRPASVSRRPARPPHRASRRVLPEPPPGLQLDSPLTVLSGVGPGKAKILAKLGLDTIEDTLDYIPRRYLDYSALKPVKQLQVGEEATVIGTIRSTTVRSVQQGKAKVTESILSDGTGTIRLSFFNQPWIARKLVTGSQLQVAGRIDQYMGRLALNNPEFEAVDSDALHTGRIVPIYGLTKGLTANRMRQWMYAAVTYGAPLADDYMPEDVLERARLLPISEALLQLHFPDTFEQLQAAQQRLAFNELFLLQLGLRQMRARWQSVDGQPVAVDDGWLAAACQSMPFALTDAQNRVLEDIRSDIARPIPMNRLVQGDVGSGKTVVAALGMAMAVNNGKQAALMAPTAILAEQHHQSLCKLLAAIPDLDLDVDSEVHLLQGSTPASEREVIYAGLADGSIKILVGTHAVIQETVEFHDLAFAVVDEQHRFGVLQRAALRSKGTHPHLLVMTATPIPRTLALSLFGDLDLSIIDEMPPGRQPVETRVVLPRERERVHTFMSKHLEQGRQCYVICPLVDESDKTDARSATATHARLEKVFPNWQVGLLHGRMSAAEKDDVMDAFRRGETHILVSTTVIEVGVDVPNATVMVIEDANRFGLAQLHQLRGRVGRGEHKSYCLLMSQTARASQLSTDAQERLMVMEQTTNGFELAEKDLEIRGPGQFLGTQQAGFNLRMAELTDLAAVTLAHREAEVLHRNDPQLEQPQHAQLAEKLGRFWKSKTSEIS